MHEDLFRLNRSPDRARYKCMPYNYTKAISNKTKISLLKRRGVQVSVSATLYAYESSNRYCKISLLICEFIDFD